MAVSANTIRSGLLTVLIVVSVVALGWSAGGAAGTAANSVQDRAIQESQAEFENGSLVEQRGDVARFTVLFDGADRATVTVGSPDVNFEASFTVVDGDGDGEATVAVNTAVVGVEGADATGVRALGDDEVADFEMATEPLPGRLDTAVYDLGLSVDGELVDVGALVLNGRSTEGMSIWTAPDAVRPGDSEPLYDAITRTDAVAQGDWAALAIEVSGIYGYVENASDFADPAYGLNVSMTEDPGMNQPERQAELSEPGVVTDEANDTLFVLVDTDDLTVGSEYDATFTIDDSNPLLEPGENESASATFAVGERTLTFADLTPDGLLELPADDEATVSGNTSVATGTTIEVRLRTRGEDPILRTGQTTVSENGSWSVAFDLSNVSNGTEFDLRTRDPGANVSGVVVAANETETPGTETPTDGTATPTEGTETATEGTTEAATPEDGTAEPGADETETPEADGTTEEVVRTTTIADEVTTESGVQTAGVTGSSAGTVALLVGAALVALRRR